MNCQHLALANGNSTTSNARRGNILFPIASSSVGVIGNIIALVILRNTKRQTSVKTRNKTFLTLVSGLLWTDVLGIIITTPPVLMVYVSGFALDKELCNIHGASMVTFAFLTPCMVGAMAVERVLAVRFSYHHRITCSAFNARFVIGAVWIISVIISILPILLFGEYVLQYPCTWCFLNIESRSYIEMCYITAFASITIILIALTVFCNLVVLVTLGQNQYNNYRLKYRASRRSSEMEIRFLIILMIMTILFSICWCPTMVGILLIHWCGKMYYNPETYLTKMHMTSVHQLIDPWLYILCHKLNISYIRRIWVMHIWKRKETKNSENVMEAHAISSSIRQRREVDFQHHGENNYSRSARDT